MIPGRESLLLAATVALTCGTTLNFGTYTPAALGLVIAAPILAGVALRAPARAAGNRAWLLAISACAAMTLVYAVGPTLPVGIHLAAEAIVVAPLVIGASVAALAHGWRSVAGAAVAASSLFVMVVLPWRWGAAPLDVVTDLQQASAAVLHGANPYATTFATPVETAPNLWASQTVHFQYLPGAAILAAPARFIGDVRVLSVVAFAVLILCAVVLARQQPGDVDRRRRILGLCLASPLTVLMVRNAWVDVYCVAGFAGWLALRHRHPRWSVAALALALTVKPTILIAAVPIALWSRPARRELSFACAAAVAAVIPFALVTGVGAFYQDVAGIQTALGFRYDGLTTGAGWFALTGDMPPFWIGPIVGAAIAFVVLRHRPRDMSDVLVGAAILSTTGFLLAKWAFMNYYFIPVWLLLLAIASRGHVVEEHAADVSLPSMPRLALLRRIARGGAPRFGVP